MFAKFSPNGSRAAYVSNNNIYVEDLEGGLITPLTSDGNERYVNGTFDWVYEEEFNCRDGFRWSRDGAYIIYWQSDNKGTGTFYLINNLDSIYSIPMPFPYPKVGDLESMELKNILTETDEAFLDLHDIPIWLDKAQNFTWISERDGWRHLYKVSRDGKGQARRISPEDEPGQHSYEMSGNGQWALHTFQSAALPPVISLVEMKNHKVVRVMEDNLALKEDMAALGLSHKEFIKIDIGDVILDAWMIRPPGFNPQLKYPVIFFVYGEPASSTVQDRWAGGDLWHKYLAEQGYVVISVDNRGTAVPRGKDWRKSIYRQIGILASEDQAAAARKILATHSFLDADRVGIWGWSGGGSMTLNCMFRYPELYKTGIAIAFVSHQKLYDTAYQERYMGLPSGNPEGFRNGSPITHAAGLEGKLLLIHGTADDNVHYQSCEMLVDQLIKLDKQFDMMAYPMRTHAIREREGTSLHLRRTMARYWKENL